MFYNTKSLHIMLMPAVIFVLLFSYVPIFGIIMAFQEYKPLLGFTGSEFVGFEQFRYIFSLPSFRIAFRNTFIIAFSKIVLNIIVPLTLSLLLNEITRSWFKRTVQTIIFIPFFFSWAILAGMVMEVFSYTGVINKTIEALGGEAIPFLISNDYFRTILVSSDVWKGMGYNTVLFLAAITNIDPTLYEAAQVDGASKWKQLTKITIPSIFTMIVLLTILGLGNILNAGFEQILIMYNPTVERTVDILDTLVYRLGIAGRQYSAAAAMGLFKSIVSMVFVGGSYWLAYKTTDYRVF
jgi:putative aldouronate transport system permease protein